MNVLLTIVLALQILTALSMIGLILLQHGKGADMGAAFGSGASGSLFGATGSANFLSRSTAVLAGVFFACTLLLAYFGNARPASSGASSVFERAAPTAPAAPGASGPAGQIPGGQQLPPGIPKGAIEVPSAPGASVVIPMPAAPAASGAAQIPGK